MTEQANSSAKDHLQAVPFFQDFEEVRDRQEWGGQVGIPETDKFRVKELNGAKQSEPYSLRFAVIGSQIQAEESTLVPRAKPLQEVECVVFAAVIHKEESNLLLFGDKIEELSASQTS